MSVTTKYNLTSLCHAGRHPWSLDSTISVCDERRCYRMIYSTSRYEHISPLLSQLHWFKARQRIDFKLAVLVFKRLNGTAPAYLVDDLSHSSDFVNRRRLRSASSSMQSDRPSNQLANVWRSSISGHRSTY
jgi:hypothetical protein